MVDPRGKNDLEAEPSMFIGKSKPLTYRYPFAEDLVAKKAAAQAAAQATARKLAPVPPIAVHRIGRGAAFPPPSISLAEGDDGEGGRDDDDDDDGDGDVDRFEDDGSAGDQ